MTGSRGHSAIGISFDGRFIKAAQLARHNGQWALAAALHVGREGGEGRLAPDDIRQLRDIFARQGFVGRRLVVGLPQRELLTSVLDLPPRSSGAPVDRIAKVELGRMHDHDAGAMEVVCWELPSTQQAKDTAQSMAVGCPHTVAEPILDDFERQGLEVQALDCESLAVLRACHGQLAEGGMTAVLDLGWDSAELLLTYQGAIVYQRTMPDVALSSETQALAESLEIDPGAVDLILSRPLLPNQTDDEDEQAFYNTVETSVHSHWERVLAELAAPFSYVAHQFPNGQVQRLLLTGRGAGSPGIAEHFGQRLGVQARTVGASDAVAVGSAVADQADDTSLTVAVGLAQFFG